MTLALPVQLVPRQVFPLQTIHVILVIIALPEAHLNDQNSLSVLLAHIARLVLGLLLHVQLAHLTLSHIKKLLGIVFNVLQVSTVLQLA